MPGPQPEPRAVREAKGNPSKRALPNEPDTLPATGEPPFWAAEAWAVDGVAMREWRRLHPIVTGMKVLTASDEDALALLCAAIAEYVEAQRVLNEEGMTYVRTTDRGGESIAVRPESQASADAWRRAQSMLAHFGLTPSSRTKVGSAGGSDDGDDFGDFDGPVIDGGRRAK